MVMAAFAHAEAWIGVRGVGSRAISGHAELPGCGCRASPGRLESPHRPPPVRPSDARSALTMPNGTRTTVLGVDQPAAAPAPTSVLKVSSGRCRRACRTPADHRLSEQRAAETLDGGRDGVHAGSGRADAAIMRTGPGVQVPRRGTPFYW